MRPFRALLAKLALGVLALLVAFLLFRDDIERLITSIAAADDAHLELLLQLIGLCVALSVVIVFATFRASRSSRARRYRRRRRED